ncbi:MAG: antitermination protein NusG [Planctomycetia bacterium]|nr:antitermination protein NusG [Planctomycetia bacterium]
MPILPVQRDLYPPGLLEALARGAPPVSVGLSTDARWLAFYTLSRREKDLMRRLEAAKLPFYSPLVRRRLHSAGGRARASYVPLFPGYVFAAVDEEQRRTALATNTISRCIAIADPLSLVHDLRSIQRLIEHDAPMTPESRIEPGHRVRVRSGPLLGLEGEVIRRSGGERLLVAVRFLNQGASIELEDVDVERL